ncbi:substrate-binding domain-containing protein [Arthrobacter nitrophenolicus]|uniref:Sugar ABC transporter substrate-binding protein n=1 Tax=Arthrobacter nitrophenolicus TaxID=683150 RepID=A0A4V3B0R1_9MICC|nr:substrate-binding domain-containing protein [Arthrobacter nitrophenolicus]TDL34008.1 sugar ABC transporter substrate-binding protein [Arthrobacter nitrophenolicus]
MQTGNKAESRHRKIKGSILALGIAVMLVLAGCSSGPTATGTQSKGPNDELTFVAIFKALGNAGVTAAKKGMEDRAKEIGNIKVEVTAPSAPDAAAQVQLIESYVQRGVDGLMVSSLGPSVCEAINSAMSRGIPVITFDSDCPDSSRLTYVGSDNKAGGQAAGQLYAEAVKGKGKQRIAILTGVLGSQNLTERDQGFEEGLKKAGVDFEIVKTVPGNDDVPRSVDAVESTLRGDQSINGFFFDGPWPFLVEDSNLPTLVDRAKSGGLTVVAFDTIQPEMDAVRNGLAYALVGQKYYGWGYQGAQVLDQIVRHGAKFDSVTATGFDLVTKDGGDGRYTPDEMDALWQSYEFKETPLLPPTK